MREKFNNTGFAGAFILIKLIFVITFIITSLSCSLDSEVFVNDEEDGISYTIREGVLVDSFGVAERITFLSVSEESAIVKVDYQGGVVKRFEFAVKNSAVLWPQSSNILSEITFFNDNRNFRTEYTLWEVEDGEE